MTRLFLRPGFMLLAAFVLVAGMLAPVRVSAQVSGRVTNDDTGEAVNGALVWLAGRTLRMAHTDERGDYAFGDVAPGGYCIRVETPGYAEARVCITVSAGAGIVVDLPLTVQPLPIEALVVQGRRTLDEGRTGAADSLRATPLTQRLAVIGSRSSALAAGQLLDLTHMPLPEQPGGQRPNALYVWGSRAERGRVTLDGASLSAPLHLGALLPPVDPGVIEHAEVHTGGISPRYDGGTAYIMDFATRPAASRARVWGELDLLAARIGAEAPINGHGRAIVSARRVNDEIIDGLVSSRFGYAYSDALARADVDVGDNSGVHVTAFATNESVSIPRDQDEDRAAWENRAATVMWRSDRLGDERTATFSASRGVADLPLLTAVGGHLEATLDRFRGQLARRWTSGSLKWDVGVDVEHLEFRRDSRAIIDPVSGDSGATSCTVALPCSHTHTMLASAFAGLSFDPARALSISVGGRTMYDASTRRVHVLPRVSFTYVPDTRHVLTLSAGRFSQPYADEGVIATEARVLRPLAVRIARATHVELGIARRTANLYLRGSAWIRHHAGIEPTRDRTVPGADIGLEYESLLGTLSLAYGVSGATSQSADLATSAPAQHLAIGGLNHRHGIWQLDINATYGSGLPLTSIVLEQPAENEVMLLNASGPTPIDRDYMRIDASIGAEWHIDRGESGFVIAPYARIVNAFSQRESLFYFQNAGDVTAPPRALAPLPAIPVIGVRWSF